MSAVLVIGSLPPYSSSASALCLHTCTALAAAGHQVSCMIEDMAPPPPSGLPFDVIRRRDLARRYDELATLPRLYVIGGDGDSLFALDLLEAAPGAVMPADLSLHRLVEPACRARGTWPETYWKWLESLCGRNAEIVFGSRIYFGRTSNVQDLELPALNLLLDKATAFVAASPRAAAALAGSGLQATAVLTLAPVAAPPSTPKDNAVLKVLHVGASTDSLATTRSALAPYAAGAKLAHSAISPLAPDLCLMVAGADIIVIHGGQSDATSPAFALALAAGKPTITMGQGWAAHVPEPCHISVGQADASEKLTVTLAALATRPDLRQHMAAAGQAFAAKAQAADIKALMGVLKASPDVPLPHPEEVDNRTPGLPAGLPSGAIVPAFKGAILSLIGAVPPDAVLRQFFPALDLANCPRFATAGVAARLSRLGGMDAARLLPRMGFETPIVATGSAAEVLCHRPPVAFSDLRQGLRHPDEAVSFACDVEGAVRGDAFLNAPAVAPSLAIKLAYDPKKRRAPLEGYLPEEGLFWRHDTLRHMLDCIMIVGASGTLELSAKSHFMVDDGFQTLLVAPGAPVRVQPDSDGFLRLHLLAIADDGLTPLPSDSLRKQLAEQGLILKWSAA